MDEIIYRNATRSDIVKLSALFKQVYIATYGVDGVSDEFANFITRQFSNRWPDYLPSDFRNSP